VGERLSMTAVYKLGRGGFFGRSIASVAKPLHLPFCRIFQKKTKGWRKGKGVLGLRREDVDIGKNGNRDRNWTQTLPP
jgi:hypothetical protein